MSAMALDWQLRFPAVFVVTLALGTGVGCTETEPPTGGGSESAETDPTGSTGEGDGDGDGDGDASSTGDGDGEAALETTYWKDTKAILDAKCVGCHIDGGIGPFALETWEQVEALAPILGDSIESLSMPPWPPNAACNTYEHNRSLDDDERELVLGWLDAGYPEGDPADAPPEPEPPAPLDYDFDVQLPEPYLPDASPDDYRCFIIDWPEEFTDTKYVVGQTAIPDQVQQVHHVITFVAGPDEADFYRGLDEAEPGVGYECFGGPGKYDWTAQWLGDWVPGTDPWRAPEGTGIAVEPGSVLIVQMHYNDAGGVLEPDQTALGFDVVDSVERPGTFIPVLDIGWVFGWSEMPIPAGDPDVHISVDIGRTATLFQYTLAVLGVGPTTEVDIWRTAMHMHLLGTHASLSITQDTGEEQCMLQIDDWDFNWQGDYKLEQPIAFGPGDTMHLDCHYDNSAANQPLVDGVPKEPETIGWGDGTYDEMCLGIVYAARK